MESYSSVKFNLIVFRILKPFGYGTFTIDENGKQFVSFWDLFWLFLNFFACAALLAISLTHMNFQSTSKSMIIVYGNLLTIDGTLLLSMFSLVLTFFNNHIIYNGILKLHNVDLQARQTRDNNFQFI